MTVESAFELYALLFGWKMYGNFWSILAFSGIVFIPFIWLILENVLQAAKSAEDSKEAAAMARLPIEIDVGIALLVIAFAGVPFGKIEANVLRYEMPCLKDRQGAAGATGTTYDQAFKDFVKPIEVPVWWQLVLRVSMGTNRAVLAGVGCAADISFIRKQVDDTRISDPALMAEFLRFRAECFQKARTLLMEYNQTMSKAEVERFTALTEEHGGVADLEWEGGWAYLNYPIPVTGSSEKKAIYDVLQADQPVGSFPLDPSRPRDAEVLEAAQQAIAPGEPVKLDLRGYPYCSQWWEGRTDAEVESSLRQRLLKAFRPTLMESLKDTVAGIVKDDRELEDRILRRLVMRSGGVPPSEFGGADYSGEGFSAAISREVAGLGLTWENFSVGPMMTAVKTALPLVKGFILMGMIMFIPFLLVVSAYRLEAVFLITFGLFAVNFLSVIWSIAYVLENGIVTALWPDLMSYIATTFTPSAPTAALKFGILNFLLAFLYLFLPMVFITVSSWAGLRVFGGIQGLIGQLAEPAGKAGRVGIDQAKNIGIGLATRKRPP